MDFGRESYDRLKLEQPSSFPAELGQESPTKEVSSASHRSCKRAQQKRLAHAAHAEELSIRGLLMEIIPKSSTKEVNSCRRAQHKRSAHATHAGEINTAHAEELSYSSCRRAQPQLMQKSSALLM